MSCCDRRVPLSPGVQRTEVVRRHFDHSVNWSIVFCCSKESSESPRSKNNPVGLASAAVEAHTC